MPIFKFKSGFLLNVKKQSSAVNYFRGKMLLLTIASFWLNNLVML